LKRRQRKKKEKSSEKQERRTREINHSNVLGIFNSFNARIPSRQRYFTHSAVFKSTTQTWESSVLWAIQLEHEQSLVTQKGEHADKAQSLEIALRRCLHKFVFLEEPDYQNPQQWDRIVTTINEKKRQGHEEWLRKEQGLHTQRLEKRSAPRANEDQWETEMEDFVPQAPESPEDDSEK